MLNRTGCESISSLLFKYLASNEGEKEAIVPELKVSWLTFKWSSWNMAKEFALVVAETLSFLLLARREVTHHRDIYVFIVSIIQRRETIYGSFMAFSSATFLWGTVWLQYILSYDTVYLNKENYETALC